MAALGVTVHWRLGQEGHSLPALDAAESWLAAPERQRLGQLKIEKRRRDWLLGRLNLKGLLVDLAADRWGVRLEPHHVVIDRMLSGAPYVRLGDGSPSAGGFSEGQRLPVSVSNSHSDGHALGAALWTDVVQSTGWTCAVGADLEAIEPRSPGFVADFLTPDERQFWDAATGSERDMRANLVWSAKEAVLKVLQRGLSADTWWLTCLPDVERAREPPGRSEAFTLSLDPTPATGSWLPFSTRCDPRLRADHVQIVGRWCRIRAFVLTVAVGQAPAC